MRHPILSTITKELFNFRSRAQGYLALFPELQARPLYKCSGQYVKDVFKEVNRVAAQPCVQWP